MCIRDRVHRNRLLVFFYGYTQAQLGEIESFCYQQQLFAAVSDPFESIDQRRFFKQQALAVLKIGIRQAPQRYLYHYIDFYTELLLTSAAERFGVPVLLLSEIHKLVPVSYTHLDVYKRQCTTTRLRKIFPTVFRVPRIATVPTSQPMYSAILARNTPKLSLIHI